MRFLDRLRFNSYKSAERSRESSACRKRPCLARSMPRLETLEDRTQPSTFTVLNLNSSGSGSLAAEVALANSSSGANVIQFANGLHGTIKLTGGELLISNSVSIDGPGQSRLTLNGNDNGRVFEIASDQTADIAGLTIANGEVSGTNGGGILVDSGATLDLDHVNFTDNQAVADNQGSNGGSGGGIENDGSLLVSDCTFDGNEASLSSTSSGSNGGAIDSSGISLTVISSTFKYNLADGISTGVGSGDGGAINNNGSTATIVSCSFSHNSASARTVNGGAISNETGTMTISNDTFDSNHAVATNGGNDITNPNGDESLGGAIYSGAPMTVANSTFTDNLAQGGSMGDNSGDGMDGGGFVGIATGGGICNFFSSLLVSDSTFTDNKAIGGTMATGPGGAAAGGGVLGGGGGATTTLTNVNFIGNLAQGGGGGPGYPGGAAAGGGFYNGIIDATAVVSHSSFLDNLAKGGIGGSGATGGAGQGGAIANGGSFDLLTPFGGQDTSSLTVDYSSLISNVAKGGTGGVGASGGNGLGGGCFTIDGTTVSIATTPIKSNSAQSGQHGKGSVNGKGIGGGIYIDTDASAELGNPTDINSNLAATASDNIFGMYTD
jgi:hypothetical protein